MVRDEVGRKPPAGNVFRQLSKRPSFVPPLCSTNSFLASHRVSSSQAMAAEGTGRPFGPFQCSSPFGPSRKTCKRVSRQYSRLSRVRGVFAPWNCRSTAATHRLKSADRTQADPSHAYHSTKASHGALGTRFSPALYNLLYNLFIYTRFSTPPCCTSHTRSIRKRAVALH